MAVDGESRTSGELAEDLRSAAVSFEIAAQALLRSYQKARARVDAHFKTPRAGTATPADIVGLELALEVADHSVTEVGDTLNEIENL